MRRAPLDDLAARLAALLSAAPSEPLDIRPLRPLAAPARVAAVDGSSVVLAQSGSHLVGALRAVCVTPAAATLRPEPEVVLLSDATAHRDLASRLGVEVAPLRAGAALDVLRHGAEWALARDAVAALHTGDLLLVDGALHARPPLLVVGETLRFAAERGIDVVGVCKSTSMTVGAAPALAACQMAARGRDAPWCAELPAPPHLAARVLVARLSRAEDRPFRFDIAAHDGDAMRALSRVAALAGHPAYPGYPSPLAMAHHAAVIAEDERRRLAADVMDAVARAGVRGEAWRAAFLDYHEVLELGV